MRGILYVLTGFAVMGLIYWAYNENYKTRQAIAQAERLQLEIGHQRQTLSILRAEWAYLNRPDRLRELADLNFQRLGLLPLRPEQFGLTSQVAYPGAGDLPITNPIDAIGTIEEAAQ